MLGIHGVIISYLCEMKLRQANVLLATILLYRATLKVFCSCIGNHIKGPHASTLPPPPPPKKT